MGLVAHSYALSSLFPYAGYMVQYLGVTDDKDEAGKFTRVLSLRKCDSPIPKPFYEASV